MKRENPEALKIFSLLSINSILNSYSPSLKCFIKKKSPFGALAIPPFSPQYPARIFFIRDFLITTELHHLSPRQRVTPYSLAFHSLCSSSCVFIHPSIQCLQMSLADISINQKECCTNCLTVRIALPTPPQHANAAASHDPSRPFGRHAIHG